MACITQPDKYGFQVRHGSQKSRYFSIRQWGGREKALEAAKRWAELMEVRYPNKATPYLEESRRNNTSTGIVGVCRRLRPDRRRGVTELIYTVCWYDENRKKRDKVFTVGRVSNVTPEQDFHAFRTAVLFRKLYELCCDESYEFDPDWFKQWKSMRLYEVAYFPDALNFASAESKL